MATYFTVNLEGIEYIVALGTEPPIKLTVAPLEFDDDRSVTVTETIDDGTKESHYSVIMPKEKAIEEYETWAGAVNVASMVMANFEELLETGVFNTNGKDGRSGSESDNEEITRPLGDNNPE